MSAPDGDTPPRRPYIVAPLTGWPSHPQSPDSPAGVIAFDVDQHDPVSVIAWTVMCNNARRSGMPFVPIAVSSTLPGTWPGWMPRPVARAGTPLDPVDFVATSAPTSLCRQAGTLVAPASLDRRTRLLTHLEIVAPLAFDDASLPIAASWDALLALISTLSLVDALALIRHPAPIPGEPDLVSIVRGSLHHDVPASTELAAQRKDRTALAVAKARVNELGEHLAAEREYNQYLHDQLHTARRKSRFAPARVIRSLVRRLTPRPKQADR